jgi:hypothetical protein
MKRTLIWGGLAITITLTASLSWRVSPDALAVIVGLFLGIMATLPASLLLLFVVTRQTKLEKPATPWPQHPPVVVVNGAERAPAYGPPALPAPYTDPGQRRWTIVGDEETET